MRKRSASLGKPRVGAKGSWSQVGQMLLPTRNPVCFPRAGGLQARVLAQGWALQGWEGNRALLAHQVGRPARNGRDMSGGGCGVFVGVGGVTLLTAATGGTGGV